MRPIASKQCPQKLECRISQGVSSYEIEIGSGLLHSRSDYLRTLASKFAIVTDDRVASLYGEQICKVLTSNGLDCYLFTFPSGEQQKTRTTKEALENQLFERGFGSDIAVIALGGGVVTDLAGYLAATYCRGVPLVMAPTTLLGMVDASIGGKTGVDTPYGKNLIGCIYQPKRVIIDPSTLCSLPKKELSGGAVEMIKHGLIADRHLFDYLEEHSEELLALDSSVLELAIFENCRIKKEIVEEDERDTAKRRLLNFGHTIGHALEHVTNYALSHGEAVAIGLVVESYLSVELGALDYHSLERIRRILIDYGLSFRLPSKFSPNVLLDAMVLDKKSLGGKPRFVTIDAIGSPQAHGAGYCTPIEERLIIKALQWMNDALCCD